MRSHASQAMPGSLSRDEARGLPVFFNARHLVFRDGKPFGVSRVAERVLAANGQSRLRDFYELDGTPVLGSAFESRFSDKDRSVRVLHQRYRGLSARASDAVAIRAYANRDVTARLAARHRLGPGSLTI